MLVLAAVLFTSSAYLQDGVRRLEKMRAEPEGAGYNR
jgi:hypothetical protein